MTSKRNPPAKTSTERVRELRERRHAIGQAEVRGIFAPARDHAEIKNAARMIVRKRSRTEKAA